MPHQDLHYILNHLGEDRENYYNAVSPAIIQSSMFCFSSMEHMREGLKHEMEQPFYTRGYNPTVSILRKKLAAIEGSEDALVFSSGSAAVAAAIMHAAKAGSHIVCVEKPYSWTNKLLGQYLSEYGVEVTYVNGKNPDHFEQAIKANTRLIFLESPNSLTFELQDIAAICAIAKKNSILTVMDNSFATGIFQNAIQMGVDIVVHSGTKHFGGHSDIVAGVLCSTKDIVMSIMQKEMMTLGAILSPHDAWLMIRGLRTLEIRLKQSALTGAKVVEALKENPKIKKIHYPFLPENEDYQLAINQMNTCAGMFSIELNTDSIQEVDAFCNALRCFLLACSWGGYESLAFPMAALYGSTNYSNTTLPFQLVRLYCGLEPAEVLISDLELALEYVSG